MDRYQNRYDAGKKLAVSLQSYANRSDVIVLALPRGGVPIGYEIAITLSLPLDIFIVRKLGVPGHEELALGALAPDGIVVFNDDIVKYFHFEKSIIDEVIEKELKELKRREIQYRQHLPFPNLINKTVILVDDGIATGATMLVAIKALRKKNPATIVVAIPVASQSAVDQISKVADKVICPFIPIHFSAVGEWYEDFSQTSDDEVKTLLEKSISR